jgi:hypothetical protein
MRSGARALRLAGGRSLQWLDRRLQTFSPCQGGYPEAWRLKAFGELALVFTYLQEWRCLPLRYLRSWRAFIIDQLDDPAYGQLARKQPTAAFAYLAPYLMLRSSGFRSAYLEDTMRMLTRRQLLTTAEMVPYRKLEREHALWKSGYSRREPPWLQLARPTALLRSGNPLGWDDDVAYSITHTLFYLTDFGNRPGNLTSRELQRAIAVVECLLIHYCRTGNWDLVGELLVNLNCLSRADSPLHEAGAQRYRSSWRNDGAVPPHRRRGETSEEERSPPPSEHTPGKRKPSRASFRRHYHSTLVAVLYCATAANAGRAVRKRRG